MDTTAALALVLVVEAVGFAVVAPAMTRRAIRRELQSGAWDRDVGDLVIRIGDRTLGATVRRVLGAIKEQP